MARGRPGTADKGKGVVAANVVAILCPALTPDVHMIRKLYACTSSGDAILVRTAAGQVRMHASRLNGAISGSSTSSLYNAERCMRGYPEAIRTSSDKVLEHAVQSSYSGASSWESASSTASNGMAFV